MPRKYLANELRAYLIDEGLVRLQNTQGGLPTCTVEFAGGAPEPGMRFSDGNQTGDITVDLSYAGGFATDWYTGFIDEPTIDVYVRARNVAQAVDTCQDIIESLVDRIGFELGDLHVEGCKLYRGVQRARVPVDDGAVYTFTLYFQVRRSRYTV